MLTVAEAVEVYLSKEAFLNQFAEKVEPLEFYRDLFPVGEFEAEGSFDDAKPNGIALFWKDLDERTSAKKRLIFDDLSGLSALMDYPAVYIAPVSFFGRKRTNANARFAYALTIDLDGVGLPQLADVFHQATTADYIPKPTYVVNSGNGLHLYYFFENPIPLYPEALKTLHNLKHALIDTVWNVNTSTIDERQYQGVAQGYRVVGSPTKLGPEYRTTAYQYGPRTTPEKLLEFVENKRNDIDLSKIKNKSILTLAQAKNKYPEWYHRRIELQEPRGHWVAKPALYQWWLKQLMSNKIKPGHRYHSIVALVSFAQKCGIDKETLKNDAFSMIDQLDFLTTDETNHFTKKDVIAALKIYDDSKPDAKVAKGKNSADFSKEYLEKITGVTFPVNKKNGASQKDHLEWARATKAIKKKQGRLKSSDVGGRPSSYQTVFDYLSEHPNARKIDVERGTGLSHPTVLKHYNAIKSAQGKETLDDVFKGYKGTAKCQEWDTGAPVGKEK